MSAELFLYREICSVPCTDKSCMNMPCVSATLQSSRVEGLVLSTQYWVFILQEPHHSLHVNAQHHWGLQTSIRVKAASVHLASLRPQREYIAGKMLCLCSLLMSSKSLTTNKLVLLSLYMYTCTLQENAENVCVVVMKCTGVRFTYKCQEKLVLLWGH